MHACVTLAADVANLHETLVSMVHRGCFPMHHARWSFDDIATKHLPDALVTHAHTEYRELLP